MKGLCDKLTRQLSIVCNVFATHSEAPSIDQSAPHRTGANRHCLPKAVKAAASPVGFLSGRHMYQSQQAMSLDSMDAPSECAAGRAYVLCIHWQ